MKASILFLIALVCLSCKEDKPPVHQYKAPIPIDSVPRPQPKINLEVVPGKSIGNISLGQNTQTLAFLGPPDLSDAAMGKAWLTWYSVHSKLVTGKSELNLYTTYADSELEEKVVRQIRVTSPDFKTASGLQVGKNFDEISGALAELDFLGSFKKPGSKSRIELYDAINLGIAFEIENTGTEKKCVALIVHTPEKKVTEEYIMFHPDLVAP